MVERIPRIPRHFHAHSLGPEKSIHILLYKQKPISISYLTTPFLSFKQKEHDAHNNIITFNNGGMMMVWLCRVCCIHHGGKKSVEKEEKKEGKY